VVTITVTEPDKPRRPLRSLNAITIEQIADGDLQEGQDLDFKREVHVDKADAKSKLLDDVVAFLNRGAGRIIVGVEERGGRFDGFRPMAGDDDQATLRLQTLIQDGISPVPVDVQVVPLHLDDGYILDIQIPKHIGAPFMNRLSGGYLIRSGSRNLPIDPGMLRSRFVEESTWMAKLDELTAAEDARVARDGKLKIQQAFRIGILPQEHFDHYRRPFEQSDHVRSPGPVFHEHSDPWFKAGEDGHEALSPQGIERLFVRDDWFVHGHAAFAIRQQSVKGRLEFHEFSQAAKRYMADLARFFADQGVQGPFAVTLSLHGLTETEHFGAWFPRTSVVRTLRPRLVQSLDEPEFVDDFLSRVRQASLYGS